MKNKELEGMFEEYKEKESSMTQKERAQLEDRMFTLRKSLVPNEGRYRSYRREWLRDVFGGGCDQYEIRSLLLSAGVWTDPLFEMLDNGSLSFGRAIRMVRLAKARAKERDISRQDALAVILEEEKKGAFSFSGKKKRGRSATIAFKTQTLESAKAFVEQACEEIGMNGMLKEDALAKFEADLGMCLDDFFGRISQGKSKTKSEAMIRISPARFRWACDVLGINPYSKIKGKKKPLDKNRVNKAARNRMAALHPDKNPGEAAAEEYHRVQKARDLLLAYIRQIKGTEE
jgi:hypothetical protein